MVQSPMRSLLLAATGLGFVFVKHADVLQTWGCPGYRLAYRQPFRGTIALRAEDEELQPSEISQRSMPEDWREFRAQLVKQESIEEGRLDPDDEQMTGEDLDDVQARGWAHATPIIETGSLLLSAPGGQFAINQQYFHKAVIFIIEHTKYLTRGVILNRPTAFNTRDLEFVLGSDLPTDFLNTSDAWNVWCGGECQGLRSREDGGVSYNCLHTNNRFAASSKEIIKGVFMIDFTDAKQLVTAGEADKDDFLLVVGYSGWGPDQLQDELDRGDTWTLAAADQQALLGRLQDAQAALSRNLEAAVQRQKGRSSQLLSAGEMGDGLDEWKSLYSALGPSFCVQVMEVPGEEDLSWHADKMLQRWIERCLIPPQYQAADTAADEGIKLLPESLPERTLLRGSPSLWVLGWPADTQVMEQAFSHGLPGQYLHRSVVLLLDNYSVSQTRPLTLVLVNGPKVGEGENSQKSVFFGGPDQLPGRKLRDMFELRGDDSYRFQGVISLLPHQFRELLMLGAFELLDNVELRDVLEAPLSERWRVAGGALNTLDEAAESTIGDVQQRLWYKNYFEIDHPPRD